MRKKTFRVLVTALVAAASLAVSGCHSRHIDSMIDNHTGAAIHQVEIDYPSASFGIDTLNVGQVYDYRFKVQGKGPIKVQYTDSAGKLVQLRGSDLTDGDDGQYLIILLPDDKVQWVPSIQHEQ
jgi:hypothetical protein